MGQENSHLVDASKPPQTLSERSLSAVAELINNGRAKRIVVMTGAGISTAAGIPDFRSPNTGLYHNLARLNLPHPEAVFEIDFFRQNPTPFYVLAKELYPGNFQPTISHVFIALLAHKKLLRKLFTQNIDCLERAAGVPGELIVEAHGSFATQRCIDCKTEYPDKEMREHVEKGEPPLCPKAGCHGLVKPDIVFFGEQLPRSFYDESAVPAMADLVIVLGTSLMVQPFASLPRMAMERTPRLLMNLERVGDLGTRADDVLCLGDCDSGIRKLADELGWRDELESLWTEVVGEKEAARQRASAQKREADMEDELEKLVKGVEDKLELSEGSKADNDANLGKQDEGTAHTEGESEAPAAGSATGSKDVGAGTIVGSGAAGDDAEEGKGTAAEDTTAETQGRGEEKQTEGAETQPKDGDSKLRVASYTPVQVSGETSSTDAGKPEDQKSDDKPSL